MLALILSGIALAACILGILAIAFTDVISHVTDRVLVTCGLSIAVLMGLAILCVLCGDAF